MSVRARLSGFGGYLPKNVVTNAELAERIDTSDEWIRTRTGIAQRHIAGEGETAVSMASAAARQALDYAGVPATGIDAVIVATATPDQSFPAVAARVQAELGITGGFAFDLSAACSGFVYALSTAEAFIRSGQARKALVIGSEVYSRILDWEDRATCVLFGDGAGAVVLERCEDEAEAGILSTHLHSDGRHGDLLFVGGEDATRPVLHMQGREVFRHAVAKLSSVVDEALERHGLSGQDIAWLVPHQANLRIIEGMARKLALPLERVVVTVDRHANTSAASIPLALNEAVRDGRIKRGELVLLEALGGGLTWGSALFRM
ncbi:beta-ketoacyl-ACP synthase III [Swaminathania salitolerans]|uniref:Beta-ketoacyl-[acyl-carrier-protein] synthase III n=1 Tax=Swaminathania salitolerans TaxID=182838 RepID=A0A511BQ47_9PROT|nr:beta-ketoacyl-ACP synthase III [Swaminathania salitolerans]GBQ10864.1 3-oxoacyl-ACP synthase [Swaminathania salitolerans LMG 21291]GEL02202.1 3-oxoacyl-[acyl-carrier-protein] synthase 3 [Swaminathania salitolerans]